MKLGRFNQAKTIAEQFEAEFISKFFGTNKDIQGFSRWLLKRGQRDAAKEINKIDVLLGESLVANEVIGTLIKKYKLHDYRLSYKLGDILSDGSIVFHVDASGKHGLASRSADEAIKTTWDQAKLLARTNGQDWHLPTRDELNLLYKHRDVVGGFANACYWSSSKYDSNKAWFKNFSFFGVVNGASKNESLRVRVVRAF